MQMNRREFLRAASAAVAMAGIGSQTGVGAEAAAGGGGGLAVRRPNIIMVITDDQGYGDASCNGNPVLRTPNIDRLHDEGVRFTDFRVSPTCAPTRAAILTGRHEFKSGVTHTIHERERLSLKPTTIAQVLKRAGYATGIFGKWHLGDEPDHWPDKRGYDEVYIHGAGGIGQTYVGTCGDAPGNKYLDPAVLHNGVFEKSSGYCTDVFFAQAIKWIDQTRGKAPFFAHVATNAPHDPLVCPPGYEDRYAGKVDAKTATFFSMIANIDDNLGRLLAKLAEWGIERDTLVVFMNDNGGTQGVKVFNAGMAGQKVTPHNGGTRAMSLWRWPGTLKPAACDALAAHVDLFPTFAELAGAKLPEGAPPLDGFSLLPLLADPRAAWHDDRVIVAHVGRWAVGAPPAKYGPCSVRWRQYLMVRDKARWALYDVKADPGQKADLSAQQPEVVARLDKAYDAWWADVLPLLENEDAHKTAAKVNPFKAHYWRQYKGPGPNGVAPPAGWEG